MNRKTGSKIKLSLTTSSLLGGALGIIFLGIVIILIPEPKYQQGFNNLNDLVSYTHMYGEKYTDHDLLWAHQVPGAFAKKIQGFLYTIGLKRAPLWSPSFLSTQLNETINKREQSGLRGDFIQKITIDEGDSIIIWGDLEGDFHSLTRDLVRLHELGYLGDDFKIMVPGTYFVFMGNAVSGGAYSLETTSVIAQLMNANPSQVIYLKGEHESSTCWQQGSIKKELEVKDGSIAEITRLFNTLPRILFVGPVPNAPSQFIRISPFGREMNELQRDQYQKCFGDQLDENLFGQFLNKQAGAKLSTFHFKDEKGESAEIQIKGVIKSIKNKEIFEFHEGLRSINAEFGAATWTVFSAPTPENQREYQFVYDAFSILKIGKTPEEWTIALHTRIVSSQEEFKTKTFKFFSGEEITPSTPELEDKEALSTALLIGDQDSEDEEEGEDESAGKASDDTDDDDDTDEEEESSDEEESIEDVAVEEDETPDELGIEEEDDEE